MVSKAHKTIVRRFIEEAANEGNLAVADELVAADFVEENGPPGLPLGSEGAKQLFMVFRNAFPDWHFAVQEMIEEGNNIVVRGTGRGTHEGFFLGIPPTGRQVKMSAIHIFRLKDGKIVGRWAQPDLLGLLQQLGAIPPTGKAPE